MISSTIIGDSVLINLVIDGLLKPDYLVPLLVASRAATQSAMDAGCSLSNVLFIPFRAQLLVKTICLVLLFSAGMPQLYMFLLLYCTTAWPMDRLNLLARFAPPPLTNDLSLRFVLSIIMPLCLVLHCVFGFGFFYFRERARGQTLADGLGGITPLLCYSIFSVLLVLFVALSVHLERRRAIKQGVLTPYQLLCALSVVHDGFHLAGIAATEKVGGMVLALPDVETARKFYLQPAAHIGADGIAVAPPPSAWLSRKGVGTDDKPSWKAAHKKLSTVTNLGAMPEEGAEGQQSQSKLLPTPPKEPLPAHEAAPPAPPVAPAAISQSALPPAVLPELPAPTGGASPPGAAPPSAPPDASLPASPAPVTSSRNNSLTSSPRLEAAASPRLEGSRVDSPSLAA